MDADKLRAEAVVVMKSLLQENERLEAKVSELESIIHEKNKFLKDESEKISYLKSKESSMQNEIQEYREQAQKLLSENNKREQSFDMTFQDLTKFRDLERDARNQLAAHKTIVEKANFQLSAILEELQVVQKDRDALQTASIHIKRDASNLKDQNADLNTELKRMINTRADFEEEQRKMCAERVARCLDANAKLRSQVDGTLRELNDAKKEIERLNTLERNWKAKSLHRSSSTVLNNSGSIGNNNTNSNSMSNGFSISNTNSFTPNPSFSGDFPQSSTNNNNQQIVAWKKEKSQLNHKVLELETKISVLESDKSRLQADLQATSIRVAQLGATRQQAIDKAVDRVKSELDEEIKSLKRELDVNIRERRILNAKTRVLESQLLSEKEQQNNNVNGSIKLADSKRIFKRDQTTPRTPINEASAPSKNTASNVSLRISRRLASLPPTKASLALTPLQAHNTATEEIKSKRNKLTIDSSSGHQYKEKRGIKNPNIDRQSDCYSELSSSDDFNQYEIDNSNKSKVSKATDNSEEMNIDYYHSSDDDGENDDGDLHKQFRASLAKIEKEKKILFDDDLEETPLESNSVEVRFVASPSHFQNDAILCHDFTSITNKHQSLYSLSPVDDSTDHISNEECIRDRKQTSIYCGSELNGEEDEDINYILPASRSHAAQEKSKRNKTSQNGIAKENVSSSLSPKQSERNIKIHQLNADSFSKPFSISNRFRGGSRAEALQRRFNLICGDEDEYDDQLVDDVPEVLKKDNNKIKILLQKNNDRDENHEENSFLLLNQIHNDKDFKGTVSNNNLHDKSSNLNPNHQRSSEDSVSIFTRAGRKTSEMASLPSDPTSDIQTLRLSTLAERRCRLAPLHASRSPSESSPSMAEPPSAFSSPFIRREAATLTRGISPNSALIKNNTSSPGTSVSTASANKLVGVKASFLKNKGSLGLSCDLDELENAIKRLCKDFENVGIDVNNEGGLQTGEAREWDKNVNSIENKRAYSLPVKSTTKIAPC